MQVTCRAGQSRCCEGKHLETNNEPKGLLAYNKVTLRACYTEVYSEVHTANAISTHSGLQGLVQMHWWDADQARTDVKKGKFSKQEKDTLKQAAQEYAQEHSLPSEDFSWLFATRTSEHKKEAAGAWQVIAQSLPHRTYKAVYACGTRMLHELNYQVS